MREYEEGYPGDANDRYYQGDHPDPDRRNRSNFGFANVKRNAETGGNKVREDATDYLNERLKVLPREETKVLFDQRVEIDTENGNVEECELPFSPGDLVKVTWDGVEYKCTVELYEGNVFLGNPDFVDNGTSNGIPFAMLNGAFDGQYYLAIIAPDYGGQSVSIKIEGNVIHPIAPKFLPEGVGGGGVMLYANEANYLFKSDDLGEESAVSMDELLGYAMEARAVVVVPYGGLDSFQFRYAGSIYRITTEVPYYGQIYTFGGSYYYTKEKVYEEAPS